MEIQFAITKIKKYASRESGDTIEMIERPHGGMSFVLVDGQRSGHSAKIISNVVARKAIQLLSEGVRDGAAARAAHDYLFANRGGKVSATLNIVSVDTRSKTVVISRNNEAPVIVRTPEQGVYLLNEPSRAVGVHQQTKPNITELPLTVGTIIIAFTDGLRHAGNWSGTDLYNPAEAVERIIATGERDAQVIADILMNEAMAKDNNRPRDDISILVTSVFPKGLDNVRRLYATLPLS